MPRPQTRLRVSRVPRAPHRSGTPPFIPQELIDLIIDQLEDDLPTLATVGLVSQAWYPGSRAYLFKEVYIGGYEPTKRCRKLLDLLKKKPLLQQCILKFALANERDDPPWLGKSAATSKTIAAILPLLTHLRRLSVAGDYMLTWDTTSAVLRAALSKAMEQPSVTELSFSSINNFDIPFVAKLQHVKTLLFHNFIEDIDPLRLELGQPPALTEELPRLESLDITTCGYVIRNLYAAAAAPGGAHHILYPKEIFVSTLGWDQEMDEAWDIVLRVSAPTVLRYTVLQDAFQPLDDIHTPPFPPAVLDLSRFTNITEFTIIVVLGFIEYQDQNPIPLLLEALDKLSQSPTPTKLRKIMLEFDFRDVDPEEEDEEEDEDDEDEDEDFDIRQLMREFSREEFWAEIDETLTRPAFGRLEEVNVLFDITYCKLPERDWTNARKRIAKAMKELDGTKGILKIESHRQLPS